MLPFMVSAGDCDDNIKLIRADGTTFSAVQTGDFKRVALHPTDENVIAVSGTSVVMYDIELNVLRTIDLGGATGYSLCFHHILPHIYVGDSAGRVRVFNWQTSELVNSAVVHGETVRELALLPKRDMIVTASWDRSVHLLCSDLSIVRTFAGHSAFVLTVAVTPDETTLISGWYSRYAS